MPTNPRPLPVDRALLSIGEGIARARRRRQMTQESLAKRIGGSVNTVRRMEAGHPGTALQHFVRVMQVFGELDKLSQILDAAQDSVGLALMDEKLPLRVRAPRKPTATAF